jgi:outer membrane immunogenic protein
MRQIEGSNMKKLALALAATAAFAGQAFAADMAARPVKALPPPAPVVNWTGCYIGGGGGYGMWNQDVVARDALGVAFTTTQTGGGRGWFGTVQGGCDYQFGLGGGFLGINQIVIGAFADYDFRDIAGDPHFTVDLAGHEKNSNAWAAGGRIGWLVTPQVLTYFSGGYTQSHYDQVNQIGEFVGQTLPGTVIGAHTYKGWFLGSGIEYATNWIPGLFWKTEYRYAELNTDRLAQVCVSVALCGALGPTGTFYDSKKFEQTIRTELVWRFNWAGPVVASTDLSRS